MFALVGERLYRLASQSNAPAIIDNVVFRLHYGGTTLLLFMCAVLATSAEHFGTPIECVSSSAPSALPRKALTTYCWLHGTFTLDADLDTYAAHPGVFKYIPDDEGMKPTRHGYYQWVCLVLFAQSISFYIPRYLWRLAENGFTAKLVEGQMPALARYVMSHQGCHGSLALSYHLCEFLNLLVVVTNFILTDLLLNGKFRDLGIYVLHGGELSRIFPRMAKCTFRMFGPSGDIERHDSLCLLAQNVFNEKVFLAAWWGYLVLAFLDVLTVLYAMALFVLPSMRRWRLASTAASSQVAARKLHVVLSNISYGDFFILRLICKNVRPQGLSTLISDCYATLGDKDGVDERSRQLEMEHQAKQDRLKLRRELLYRQNTRDDTRLLLEGYTPEIIEDRPYQY